MIKIAIVEDEQKTAFDLRNMLLRLAPELQHSFDIACFHNAEEFLTVQRGRFDLVFIDIQMPGLSGLEAAAKLRETDRATVLIFVTSLAQFALAGYEVDASDFLVKPVDMGALNLCLRRALKQLSHRQEKKIMLSVDGVRIYLPVSEIFYIEVSNHQMIYHALSGDYTTYDSMNKVQKELEEHNFFRCNSCYLVNLRYVSSVDKFIVNVHGAQLQISHPRKKAFMEALNRYIGG